MFDLPNLYYVDLGFNLIERFPQMYLPSLAFLDLDNNRIRNISDDYLRALPNLRELSIRYNLIGFLPDELSHGNLKDLYLQGNYISCVPSHLANNFPELDSIYLSDNRIVSLADITGALAVYSIFLDNNQIENVRGSDLQVQHNSPALYLQSNFISVLNFSAPANIRAVYLENNRVEKVVIGAVNSQILFINLSHNRLSSLSFANQFPDLVSLELRGNMITSVTRDTFRTTLVLKELDLSSNEIKFLESRAFSRLAYLFAVDLSNNQLHVLEESTFPHEKLHKLDLSMNRLSNVSPNIFTGNPSNLEIFDLSDNTVVGSLYAIINISRNILILDLKNFSRSSHAVLLCMTCLRDTEFTGLQFLYISSLNLANSVSMHYVNAPSLRVAELKYNNLKTIPVDYLSSTVDIEMLNLEGNNIRSIQQHDFDTVQKLFTINLSKNLVTHIAKGAFEFTVRLQLLILSHNFIKHLWYEPHFPMLIKQNGLILDGNPWNCTCELNWLQNELMSTETETEWRCASPLYMSNRIIVEEDLVCPPTTCSGVVANQVVKKFTREPIPILFPIVPNHFDRIEWLIITNSTALNESTGALEKNFATGIEQEGGLPFISPATVDDPNYLWSDYIGIECKAVNWAGTEKINIILKVRDRLDGSRYEEDDSITVEEWNEHVKRMCHQSTSRDMTSTHKPSTSRDMTSTHKPPITSQVELSYSNALIIILLILFEAFVRV